MYSLSTGIPPTRLLRRSKSWPNNRSISSVRDCFELARFCASMMRSSAILLELLKRPCTENNWLRKLAMRCWNAESCSCFAFKSAFTIRVSPRISNSCSCRSVMGIWSCTAEASKVIGGELSVISSNRIMAPKPQEITSRNAMLEDSESPRRLRIMANPSLGLRRSPV